MRIAVVTHPFDLWAMTHLTKLFVSVMCLDVSELGWSLHSGEKWTFPGHNSFLPKEGFISIRLSLPQWSECPNLRLKSWHFQWGLINDSLLEDTNQINFILSVCTTTLQNTFHVEAFPSISIADLFPVIDVCCKLHEHAQNCLMQINS